MTVLKGLIIVPRLQLLWDEQNWTRSSLSENTGVASFDKVITGGRQGLATGSPDLEVAASDTTTVGPQPSQGDGISLVHSQGGRATNVASFGSASLVDGIRVGPSAVSVIASPEVTEVINKVAGGQWCTCQTPAR